jgi:hypothetical protein
MNLRLEQAAVGKNHAGRGLVVLVAVHVDVADALLSCFVDSQAQK